MMAICGEIDNLSIGNQADGDLIDI